MPSAVQKLVRARRETVTRSIEDYETQVLRSDRFGDLDNFLEYLNLVEEALRKLSEPEVKKVGKHVLRGKKDYNECRNAIGRLIESYKPGDAFTAHEIGEKVGINGRSAGIFLSHNAKEFDIIYVPKTRSYKKLETKEVKPKTEKDANREKVQREVEKYPVGDVFTAKAIAESTNLDAKQVAFFLRYNKDEWHVYKENGTYRRIKVVSEDELKSLIVSSWKAGAYDPHQVSRETGWPTRRVGAYKAAMTRAGELK